MLMRVGSWHPPFLTLVVLSREIFSRYLFLDRSFSLSLSTSQPKANTPRCKKKNKPSTKKRRRRRRRAILTTVHKILLCFVVFLRSVLSSSFLLHYEDSAPFKIQIRLFHFSLSLSLLWGRGVLFPPPPSSFYGIREERVGNSREWYTIDLPHLTSPL